MLYSNDSEAAIYACEEARTGRYGYDEYDDENTIEDYDDEGDWKDELLGLDR